MRNIHLTTDSNKNALTPRTVRMSLHVRPSSLLKRFATVDEVVAIVTHVANELPLATNGAAPRG